MDLHYRKFHFEPKYFGVLQKG